LQRIEEQRMLQALTGKPRPTAHPKPNRKGAAMTAERMCELGHGQPGRLISVRAGKAKKQTTDLDLRDEIQRIALEFPCYGGRGSPPN
jgi:sRNA-binding protein